MRGGVDAAEGIGILKLVGNKCSSLVSRGEDGFPHDKVQGGCRD
jgi:hypothetical protein